MGTILTKQFLEKNGFVYEPNSDEPDDGWWYWRNLGVSTGNEYISIAFRDDTVAVYDLGIMKGNNSGDFHFNFIEQLQAIVDLLEIDKKFI